MVVFICQFTKSLRFVFPSSLLRLQLQSRLQGRPNLFLYDNDGDDGDDDDDDGDDGDYSHNEHGDNNDSDDDDGGDIGNGDTTAGVPPSFSLPPIE